MNIQSTTNNEGISQQILENWIKEGNKTCEINHDYKNFFDHSNYKITADTINELAGNDYLDVDIPPCNDNNAEIVKKIFDSGLKVELAPMIVSEISKAHDKKTN